MIYCLRCYTYKFIHIASSAGINKAITCENDCLPYVCFVLLFLLLTFADPWRTTFTQPRITHFEMKNSRPIISTLTAYEITPTTILKHFFP